jgi:hypothetical protein
MILGAIFERFIQDSPISVLARGTMQFALNRTALDELFDTKAQRQYTRELLFSTTVDVMSLVVCRIRPSVHAAYQALQDRIGVSVKALYDKLSHMEPTLSASLVEYSAERLRPVIRALRATRPPLLPGYQVRLLDGNHLAGTERRLKELRRVNGGALPGQALCVLDPEYRVRPADRVLDRVGLIPPKGGPDHDPREAARCAERTPVAAVDHSLAGERVERAGVLRTPRARRAELLRLAEEVGAAGRGGTGLRAGPGRARRGRG